MAHFAEIGANNIVLRVIVVSNSDCLDKDGKESEAVGAAFCHDNFGGTWLQTSYNAKFRKNYAGEGFHYDDLLDAFIPPQPYPSWNLNVQICQWEPPVPYPTDGKMYVWDEATLSWVSA